MPIIKSAIKRAKQTKVRQARNLVTKRNVRSSVKAFDAAVASGNGAKVAEALKEAQSALDTAVKKNLIHKNRASRRKAQLSKQAKAVSGATPTKAAAKKAPAKKAAAKPATKKTAAKKPAAKKAPAKKAAAKK
jgi:ribosomal protein S20